MAIPLCELEGTRDEILAQFPEFAEQRLHVVIYPMEAATIAQAEDPRITLLRQVAARTRQMNLPPSQQDFLRIGRSGEMFGDEIDE